LTTAARATFASKPTLRAHLYHRISLYHLDHPSIGSANALLALPLLQEALSIRMESLGEHDPDTLDTQHALAEVYIAIAESRHVFGAHSEVSVANALRAGISHATAAFHGRANCYGHDQRPTLASGFLLARLKTRIEEYGVAGLDELRLNPTVDEILIDAIAHARESQDEPTHLLLRDMMIWYAQFLGSSDDAEKVWQDAIVLFDARMHPLIPSGYSNLLQSRGEFEHAEEIMLRYADSWANLLPSHACAMQNLYQRWYNDDGSDQAMAKFREWRLKCDAQE